VCFDPGTLAYDSARWLLLESELFFSVCSRAGIDAYEFRTHLIRVEAGEFEENDD
jgi:hypothetical protein